MIKLTFTLAVALYAGFVIWGQPTDDLLTDRSTRDIDIAAVGAAQADPVLMEPRTADAEVTRAAVSEPVVPDAAVIAASAPTPSLPGDSPRLIGEPVIVSLVQPQIPVEEDVTDAAAEPEGARELLKVTGSRVNMRAGPSTANAVVDSLPGGTVTEALGAEENGWIQIRDVESGRTGYMSARFLAPA
ncbi:SH3 domain-containing protein [Jannaschia marina]|uniref:SH3 domain-containing protein n=1 Tax=Jannaschia marina TaxID=2741674 RepID=UPI0015CE3C94|nr:SH3 domain-containing protein [Jannaschia marina]